MELSCSLGIRALSHKENLSRFGVLSHIKNPLLTKLVFLRVYGSSSRSIKKQKKNLANMQPS